VDDNRVLRNALRYEFAKTCFLDIADNDYIAVRTLFRNCCYHQSFILMQQAIEKYLKAILLYNKIAAKKEQHKIKELLKKCQQKIASFSLSEDVVRFIQELDGMENSRYLTYSTAGFYEWLPILDKCVWQLRVFAQADTKENKETIERIMSDGLDKYVGTKVIFNGSLERILAGSTQESTVVQHNLTWRNHYYFEKGGKQPLKNINIGGLPLISLFDSYAPPQRKLLYDTVKDFVYTRRPTERIGKVAIKFHVAPKT